MYSIRVRDPSELCGLTSLSSLLHSSIFSFASARSANQLTFKHSSRSLPLKLSMWPFSVGLAGRMNCNAMPCSNAQASSTFEINTGPLSNANALRPAPHRNHQSEHSHHGL